MSTVEALSQTPPGSLRPSSAPKPTLSTYIKEPNSALKVERSPLNIFRKLAPCLWASNPRPQIELGLGKRCQILLYVWQTPRRQTVLMHFKRTNCQSTTFYGRFNRLSTFYITYRPNAASQLYIIQRYYTTVQSRDLYHMAHAWHCTCTFLHELLTTVESRGPHTNITNIAY